MARIIIECDRTLRAAYHEAACFEALLNLCLSRLSVCVVCVWCALSARKARCSRWGWPLRSGGGAADDGVRTDVQGGRTPSRRLPHDTPLSSYLSSEHTIFHAFHDKIV